MLLTLCVLCSVSAEQLLLFDDFSDGSLTNPPETFNNPIWKARYYTIPVPVDDGSGNNMILKDASMAIYAGSLEWTDYEVEIKFRVLSNSFYALHTYLRYDGKIADKSYDCRILNTGTRLVYQIAYDGKQSDEALANLGTTALETWGTGWHTYKVRIVGNHITAYIDGEEISSAKLDPYLSKGNISVGVDRHGGTSDPFLEIDYIKVTDRRPTFNANPQVIAADEKMESIINVNWIAGGKVRVKSAGSTMTDLLGTPIDEAVVSTMGEVSFKVKGTVAEQLPLEVSVDGIDWWEPLPDQKAVMLVPVAHPTNSSMYIPDFQEGQRFPAAGEEHPVTVKVNIVDYDEENVGLPGRHKVSLVKTAGGPGIISSPQILDGEGEVTFSLTSIESGTVTLEAQVVPVDENGNVISGIQPAKLTEKITIIFDQAISPTDSIIEIVDNEPVSADGVSKQKLKVTLKDFKGNVIGGRGVTFTPLSYQEQVNVLPTEATTNEEGIAFFEITATSDEKIAVPLLMKGRLIGEADSLLQDIKDFELAFESPVKVESGEIESKMLSQRSLVAEIAAYPGLANDAVPADGASSWLVTVELFDQSGNPAVGRKVFLNAGERSDVEIKLEQQEARTDSNGVVSYSIRTQKELTEILTVNLQLDIMNDLNILYHSLKFAPDGFKPVVLSTVPAEEEERAEVSAPIIMIFNEPVTITAETKIKLEATDGELIEELYLNNESNWTYFASEYKIVWQHKRLRPNVWFTAEISGVSDKNGNIMEPYSWDFSAEDVKPPYILLDENEVLLTSPRPGEPEVSMDYNVEIPFNEPLNVDELGKPVGFNVGLYKDGLLVEEISEQELEYIEQNGDVIVKFSLSGLMTDSTYTIVVSGAKDLANLVMAETQWSFGTLDTKAAEVLHWSPIGEINEKDFPRIIEIQFSDDVDISTGTAIIEHNETTYNLETLSYDDQCFTWRLKPQVEAWAFDEVYEIILEGIKKRIANPYGTAIIKNPLPRFSRTFTIIGGAPQVLAMDVLGGSETAELNADIKVTFDRFIMETHIPNIYILDRETQWLLDFVWEFSGGDGNLCSGLIINPTNELLLEYDSDYIIWIEDLYSESGQPADFRLNFHTKVEETATAVVVADGTNQSITLEFSDNTGIALNIPGDALSMDTEFYAKAVRTDAANMMVNSLSTGQGVVAAYEIVTRPNVEFAAPIKITFPFIKAYSGMVKAKDSLGNEIFVPCEQLFVARWRSWETHTGQKVGEWVPLESALNLNNNSIGYETDRTGIFAILGYKAIENVELLGEVRFTQNPLFPGQAGKRSETILKFYLAEPSVVTLNVFDRNGRFITTLVDNLPFGEGYHGLPWDGRINGRIISRGMYMVQIRVSNDEKSERHHVLLAVW